MAAKKSYDQPPVISHSGPSGLLAGFDARNREIGSASGGTVTAKLLKRPGQNVPAEKKSMLTPANHFKPVPHSQPEVPVAVQKWHKKYSLKPGL